LNYFFEKNNSFYIDFPFQSAIIVSVKGIQDPDREEHTMTIYVARVEWKDDMTNEYKSRGKQTGFKDREQAERYTKRFDSPYCRTFIEEVEVLK
jgi:hypothetical protein